MKKTFLLFVLAWTTITVQAAYFYDATCFETDFAESNLPAGVTMTSESGVYPAGSYSLADGKMTIDFGAGLGQYKNVLTISLATPIDLSGNATLVLKGYATNTIPSGSYRVRVRLFSADGKKGPSDGQIWNTTINFVNSATINQTFNFANANFKNDLDLSKINKIEIQTNDAGPLTGSFTFEKIKLGAVVTPPLVGYVDGFSGANFSDPSVSLTVDGGMPYTIANQKLNFTLKSNPGWGQIFEFKFANLMDMTQNKSIYLNYSVTPSCSFQVRFEDASGAQTTDGASPVFFGTGVQSLADNTEINWSKVRSVRFYDKGAAGSNVFAIDSIRVGQDIALALENTPEDKLVAYPTYAKDVVSFNSIVERVEVYNLSGTMVMQIRQVNKIDVGALPKGVYLIKNSASNGVARFIKD